MYSLRIHKYDLILVPGNAEVHQDHGVILAEAQRAFYDCAVWGYEHPMRTLPMENLMYVILNEGQMQTKLDAIAQYKSQVFRRGLQPRAVLALAQLRGCQACSDSAEAFEIIRGVL